MSYLPTHMEALENKGIIEDVHTFCTFRGQASSWQDRGSVSLNTSYKNLEYHYI